VRRKQNDLNALSKIIGEAHHLLRLTTLPEERSKRAYEFLTAAIHLVTLCGDLLFVTGDLTTWGDRKSLKYVKSFLGKLKVNLGLTTEQVQVIPGNHDLLIDYRRITSKHRNYTKIFGQTPPVRKIKMKGFDIAVFSFDSTIRDGMWLVTSNRGAIPPSAFNEFNRAHSTLSSDRVVKLVQVHHHPLPIPYKNDQGVGGVLTTMTNGSTFANKMQECGVHVIFHGHEHVPYAMKVQYHPDVSPMVVVAAGTPSQQHSSELSFNYLVMAPFSSISRQRYVYRETGFSLAREGNEVWRYE
jgi:3',5'-cyclic AMP phosphodiesterase CpdA